MEEISALVVYEGKIGSAQQKLFKVLSSHNSIPVEVMEA